MSGAMSKWDQPYRYKFAITTNKLTYIAEDGVWTQFVFNAQIPLDQIYTFRIKVVKTDYKGRLMIGVVDFENQKHQRESSGSNNAICYHGTHGTKFPSGAK